MIRELGKSDYTGYVGNQSVTCDNCGVLIGTMMDFHYNDDYAVDEFRVKESVMYCGRCDDNGCSQCGANMVLKCERCGNHMCGQCCRYGLKTDDFPQLCKTCYENE